MDKDLLKNFIENAKQMRLDERDKFMIRHALVRKMNETRQTSRSSIFSLLIPRRIKAMPLIIIIALIITGGAGVSVAAEAALPGDALHVIKISVNEKVMAAVALTSEAKVKVEAKFAERRLEEAEALAVENRLDADVRAKIEANFKAHADRVQVRIADFEAREDFKAAADIASNFETSLRAHEGILARLKIKIEVEGVEDEVEELEEAVEEEADEAEEVRVKVEGKVKTEGRAEVRTAAEGRINAAENKIVEVKAFIANQEAKLGVEAVAEAKAELAEAEAVLAEAKAKLEAGAFGEAFVKAGEAHRTAQEAKLEVELEGKVDVEVKVTP